MGKNRTRASGSSAGGFYTVAGSGYSADGISLYTRSIAHGRAGAAFVNAAPARLAKGRKLPLQELIREYTGRIRWLEAELRTAVQPAKRDKLNLQLEIKRRRLVELQMTAAEAGVS